MHKGLPSFTALCVASARALASSSPVASCNPGDLVAHDMLPPAAARGLALLEHRGVLGPLLPRAVALASFGLVDHLALRTAAIDAALLEGLERGIDQVVILGAGLDTRAHRLPGLSRARVLEVDHPDTQARKRQRARSVPVTAAELQYVPVDFARQALGEQLALHTHDSTRPTYWIWEGVVPYLERSAIADTLRVLQERSAPGSELAVTYVPGTLPMIRRTRAVLQLGMRLIGEPLRSLLDREDLALQLHAAAFRVTSDTDTRDWRRAHGTSHAVGLAVTYERLALARRS